MTVNRIAGAKDPKSKPRTPKREPQVPFDTRYTTEVGPLTVEIVDVQLRPATNRGILAEIRTSAGPFDLTLRVVVADGDPFVAFPSHTVRGHNGRTRHLHRVRIKDQADAKRFDEFILNVYQAAVDQWGHPDAKTVRPRPHRVGALIDQVEHIRDAASAWQALLSGLERIIKSPDATNRELTSACRMLNAAMGRAFRKAENALACAASAAEPADMERLRGAVAEATGAIFDTDQVSAGHSEDWSTP